jgi:Gluconate 2-dehydrogenase subunit 3
VYLSDDDARILAAAVDLMIPPAGEHPGAAGLGVVDYIDGLLGAFRFDPPRIFAGGPFSGRAGGDASFAEFLPLRPIEELAWRIRIEGSQDQPEREFNGPVQGWQEIYREGIAALGTDFEQAGDAEQRRRLASVAEFRDLLYGHANEGCYGAPEYGGNRDQQGWRAINFPGDVQPRGYTDEEVSGRD